MNEGIITPTQSAILTTLNPIHDFPEIYSQEGDTMFGDKVEHEESVNKEREILNHYIEKNKEHFNITPEEIKILQHIFSTFVSDGTLFKNHEKLVYMDSALDKFETGDYYNSKQTYAAHVL